MTFPTLFHALDADVDVHALQLDAPATRADADAESPDALATLSLEERARASRFRRPEDGRRWAAVRGALRRLLSERLGCDAASIDFVCNAYGKPDLARGGGADAARRTTLAFNVSHSADRALIAIATSGAVGVDIERIRDTDDPLALAALVFSARECEILADVAVESARRAAFYAAWSRKEAALKALGTGLGHGARRVEVGVNDGPSLRFDGDRIAGTHLIDLPAPTGFSASLCLLAEGVLDPPLDARLRPLDDA